MSEILESVRGELLGEAQRSPGLLADLANLERYVAESYSARSFIELLQNADDAEAERFRVERIGDRVVCANDGRAFSRQDFHSLCRSAHSDKKRGQTIGYRGIGFKSVVGVASEVHLISGNLQATFSRELTRQSLGLDTVAPLVRIPHPLALAADAALARCLRRIAEDGYTTVFVLGGLDHDKVEEEFQLFDGEYLLFLRHVVHAHLVGKKDSSFSVARTQKPESNHRIAVISGSDQHTEWRIHSFAACDVAFSLVDGRPVPLTGSAAIAHAFLPTLEQTGLGVRINADFSTDPSRTRIVFDKHTEAAIKRVVDDLGTLFIDAVHQGEFDIARCLSPTLDLATIGFQKRSMRTELITGMRERLAILKDSYVVSPPWLNPADSRAVSSASGKSVIVAEDVLENGLNVFLRYLGMKPLSFDDVAAGARRGVISSKGCAEVAVFAIRNCGAGIAVGDVREAPIWIGSGRPTSLTSLVRAGEPLTEHFLHDIVESGISRPDMIRGLRRVIGDSASDLVPDDAIEISADEDGASAASRKSAAVTDPFGFDPLRPDSNKRATQQVLTAPELACRFLPAWRGAEEFVAELLRAHGYTVEDRSRQNLGYDLYAAKSDNKCYIEVKLLDYSGQPFVITPNEEAVARECGESYVLALILRGKEGTHVQFIHHPVAHLNFVRQCRQWVWECSTYDFSPNFYEYDRN